MEYETGSHIGDYEIINVLGAGGMGRVYKVRNMISDRVEAMKVLLPDLEGNSDLADRFMREIKVQASLDHPNIAALHTALRMNNQLLMLMEYVEGKTLADILQSGPVSLPKVMDYMGQVLSALGYAHSRNIVHRDIKPANIMITDSGQVKLMDFGIAKMALDSQITQTGSTLGSLYYMSPEQIKDTKEADRRSDLYSLGVTLYEAVTRVRPFQGDSGYSIMSAHLESVPKPPIEITPGLPEGLNDIILKALEKDPQNRFQTAEDFQAALIRSAARDKGVSTSATTLTFAPHDALHDTRKIARPESVRPKGSRSRKAVLISLLAIVIVLLGAVMVRKLRGPVEPPQALTDTSIEDTQTDEIITDPASEGKKEQIPPEQKEDPASIQTASQENADSRDLQEPVPAGKADSGTSDEITDLRKQYDLLSGVRAAVIRAAIGRMDPQNTDRARMLRMEAQKSVKLMDYHLAEAESALNLRDVPEAKSNLEAAETEIEKLEKMLRLSTLVNRRPAAKRKLQ